jgi:NHLM bacteriocin system ABC transporter ATP-binding protein
LAFRKEDGAATVFYPRPFTGYYYFDENGQKVRINEKTMEKYDDMAICFYRPLPLRKLAIKDLLDYLIGCIDANDIIVVVIMTLVTILLGSISPKLTALLTGPVLATGNVTILISMAIFMISMNITTLLIDAIKSLLMQRISIKTSISVEAAVMMRLMSLPARFFRNYSSGELSSRASSVNSLCSMLISGILSTGLTSIFSLVYVGQISTFAPCLLVPSLITIIATVLVSVLSSLLQIKISGERMKIAAKESGMSYALVTGIQKIKLSGSEKRAFARWGNLYAKEADYSYNPPILLKVNSVITQAISLISIIVIYYLAVVNNLDQSAYFAFNNSYGMVMGAFTSMASIVLSFVQVKPILDMAEPILNEVPENAEEKQVLTKLNGNIEMNNVYFRYEDNMPYVVDGLSLKIKAGEYIAIVGKTGCGKSTLVRLLLGFEKPEKGAIYYDNKDINKIDLRSLRRKIGTVTQNGTLFTGDIYSNISISAPQLTMDEAWEAAEIAGIAEDIREMPMGMQTLVMEGNGGISGGQRQRLMIARAIAPKPSVLIFDEATSALDNKTQKQVSEALDKLKCTRIVIAHRLSTIRHCDRILVLDGGKIIEDGTYDELIDLNGFFASLVERQRLDLGDDEEEQEEV